VFFPTLARTACEQEFLNFPLYASSLLEVRVTITFSIFSCLSLVDMAAYRFFSFSLFISAGVFFHHCCLKQHILNNYKATNIIKFGKYHTFVPFLKVLHIDSGVTPNKSLEAQIALGVISSQYTE